MPMASCIAFRPVVGAQLPLPGAENEMSIEPEETSSALAPILARDMAI